MYTERNWYKYGAERDSGKKKIVLLRKYIDLCTYVNVFIFKKSQLLEFPQILRGPSNYVSQRITCLILNFK